MTRTFLTGPAGTGKTTRALARLRELLAAPDGGVLVLVPHPALARPYRAVLAEVAPAGDQGAAAVLTMSGLVRQTIDRFWPQIAGPAGFGRPEDRPVFLTIETAQHYLRQAIEPLLQEGYFDPNVVPVRLPLPRLLVQILNNLNRAAILGLPHSEIGSRLAAAIAVEPGSRVALEQAQTCANRFRDFCLAFNLLDFSLRLEVFRQHLWPLAEVRRDLAGRYRHLVADNIEEDNAFSHAILAEWLPDFESALLVYDEDAAYRVFLGASGQTAQALAGGCDETIRLVESHVAPADMLALGDRLAQSLVRVTSALKELKSENETPGFQATSNLPNFQSSPPSADPRRAVIFQQERFYPQMIEWVIDRVAELLAEGTPPDEIVVLAPFVGDALRFAFINGMARRSLPARSYRPSQPLSQEPAAKTVRTLARLAWPGLNPPPEPVDVAQALGQAIAGLDPIRADLLARIVYRPYEREEGYLTSFEQIEGLVRERIGPEAGERFDTLRDWLRRVPAEIPAGLPLDEFWQRLAGEVLAQPGFGFHERSDAAEVIANLVDAARRFRQVAARVPGPPLDGSPETVARVPDVNALNRAFLEMIEQESLVTQSERWTEEVPAGGGAVLLAPVTTFLMSNRPVDYQIWLDTGSGGWWEHIAQPLTHPFVLNPGWEPGRSWTDADEVASQRDRLVGLILGLTRRCRRQIILTNSEIGEQGYEQRGPLLIALQHMQRRLSRELEAKKQ